MQTPADPDPLGNPGYVFRRSVKINLKLELELVVPVLLVRLTLASATRRELSDVVLMRPLSSKPAPALLLRLCCPQTAAPSHSANPFPERENGPGETDPLPFCRGVLTLPRPIRRVKAVHLLFIFASSDDLESTVRWTVVGGAERARPGLEPARRADR